MTFADFVASIQAEVNDTSTRLKTLIEGWVNQEHSQICNMRDWLFLVVEKSEPATILVAGMPYAINDIPMPGATTLAAKRILAICDTTDGSEYPLDFTTIDQIREEYPSYTTFSGKPVSWYYVNESIQVWPFLDQTRTFVFSFTKATTTYTSGQAVALLIPDEYLSVLTHKVLIRVWKYKTDERWQSAERDYALALKDMIASCASRVKMQYRKTGQTPERLPKLSSDS